MKMFHEPQRDRVNLGFTLAELIIATAIMGVLLTLAWMGLISALESDRKHAAELDRKHELNRAADFIADDIRSGAKVSIDVKLPDGPNQGLFEIRDKNDIPTVAYYLTPKGASHWKGPYVLRRKLPSKRTQALVDGISDSLSLDCLKLSGIAKHKGGVRVTLMNDKSLKICLVGHVGNGNLLSVTRQVNVRN